METVGQESAEFEAILQGKSLMEEQLNEPEMRLSVHPHKIPVENPEDTSPLSVSSYFKTIQDLSKGNQKVGFNPVDQSFDQPIDILSVFNGNQSRLLIL